MKFIFANSIILIICSCKSTNYIKYHNRCNEAEYSFYNEDYVSACVHYGKAFKKVNIPLEQDMVFYAMSLWQIDEKERSIGLLDTLLSTEWILSGSGYFDNMDPILKHDIIAKNRANIQPVNARRDAHPLNAIFDTLIQRDQKPRLYWQEMYSKYGDGIEAERAWMKLAEVDSMNVIVLDSIINIYGFVGGVYYPSNPQVMHLFMMHCLDWVNENPKMFRKAIKQGRLLPSEYALGKDKFLISKESNATDYGQFNPDMVKEVSPEIIFSNCKRIGVSPYYNEWVQYPRKKGVKPEKHYYYNYYEERKSNFSCY